MHLMGLIMKLVSNADFSSYQKLKKKAPNGNNHEEKVLGFDM